jgi:hypothetical protein
VCVLRGAQVGGADSAPRSAAGSAPLIVESHTASRRACRAQVKWRSSRRLSGKAPTGARCRARAVPYADPLAAHRSRSPNGCGRSETLLAGCRTGRAAVVSTDPDLAPAFCRRGIPALIAPSTPQSDPHPCARRCRRPRVASKPGAAYASTPPRRCRKGVGRGGSIGGVPTNQSVLRDLDRDVPRRPRDHLTFMLAMRRAMRRFGSTPSRSSTAASLAQMRFGLASCAHIRRGDSARRLPSRSVDRFFVTRDDA